MTLGWLALARGDIDRMAERRRDEDWVAAAWAGSRVLVVDDKGRVPVRLTDRPELVYVPSRTAPKGERVLLGIDEDKIAYFAVCAPIPDGIPDAEPTGLRRIGALLADVESTLMTQAVAMAAWHGAHRFCPRCGAPTKAIAAGHVRVCTEDGGEQYPRLDPAVIMLVADADDRVLLARGVSWPERRASVLAGFIEPGESMEQAVAREVKEEVGLDVGEVTYMGSQPWPMPQSLMLGFSCRTDDVAKLKLDKAEIAEAYWYTRDELKAAALNRDVLLPGRVSIARQLIEHWYGADLPGSWGL
ncbi:NAD(+) diphosphatase [Actinocorallia sp. A-T 12471]|uniref:NAD(+) diphosphatase n=1 Tax=Actinocorallia sp. A-T 12471 TaxID=3089813 RepID=UPI0029CE78B7|nr:NAD(+) diphosphatase [Actinocorallia sp. A-T 12471]MDX6738836.1 NAD(+) diphosphatase [Actinocorallia sp. A-T 12471]